MFVGRTYPLFQTLNWTKKYIAIFTVISAVPVIVFVFTGYRHVLIPWLPISLVGIAVAFYLGFKNNASYDRLWEARKIWGGIVNSSRSFGVLVKGYVRRDLEMDHEAKAAHERLINRHIAWLHSLRFQLRTPREWEHKRTTGNNQKHVPVTEEQSTSLNKVLEKYISPQELDHATSKQNWATHVLDLQMDDLSLLRKSQMLDSFQHVALGDLLKELYEHQGKCERIKNFPFPRQYASLNIYFVWLFIVLLPFGIIQEFAKIGEQFVWLTIPFSVVIAWVFHTMELIGDHSENPFEGLNNDIPITALVRTIEIDLLQMIDAENIPKPLAPINKVLM